MHYIKIIFYLVFINLLICCSRSPKKLGDYEVNLIKNSIEGINYNLVVTDDLGIKINSELVPNWLGLEHIELIQNKDDLSVVNERKLTLLSLNAKNILVSKSKYFHFSENKNKIVRLSKSPDGLIEVKIGDYTGEYFDVFLTGEYILPIQFDEIELLEIIYIWENNNTELKIIIDGKTFKLLVVRPSQNLERK